MFVELLLPLARERLVTVSEGAPLIEAAALLRPGVDLLVVCGTDGSMVGVISKTDVVDQISHCRGASCTCAISSVMTRDVLLPDGSPCPIADGLEDYWR